MGKIKKLQPRYIPWYKSRYIPRYFVIIFLSLAFIGISSCTPASYSVVWTIPKTSVAIGFMDLGITTEGFCVSHLKDAIGRMKVKFTSQSYGLGASFIQNILNDGNIGCVPTKDLETASYYKFTIQNYRVNNLSSTRYACPSCWSLIKYIKDDSKVAIEGPVELQNIIKALRNQF